MNVKIGLRVTLVILQFEQRFVVMDKFFQIKGL